MRITNLTKRYKDTVALDNISVEFEKGKVTAVLGESGAGKTTLLNAIAGLTRYEGTIEEAGNVSYLFQDSRLLPHLSAEGNVKFVLKKEEQGRAAEMLARVGLSGKEKRYPHELSGGEQRRVAIARALLFPHDTLLMDEPFSSLDLSLKRDLLSLVTELCLERKETVVFVTHDVREAALFASRAIVIKGGKVVDDIPVPAPYPRDFFTRYPEEEALEKILVSD
ncbi:MAG: ABC transporter ATP-binding protein [Clostridia bacterium]|nr:ABC transporter ATP-binding protein [Clostridia bacterium]